MSDTFIPGTTAGTPTVNPIGVTTQESLSPSMKTFYTKALLENAREDIIFSQFGKKQALHGGRVEWRKFNTFEKALTPLEEGVIPTGEQFGMDTIEAVATQHGSYTALSDRIQLESYDDILYGASEEMGAAMASTFDILTRNALIGGNSVMYAPKIGADGSETEVTSRSSVTSQCLMTPKVVNRAATWLKKNKAPKIDGYYVAIIHPSVALDLRQSEEWQQFHQYSDASAIFKGEIGTLHGVRFVESPEAKVYKNDGTCVYLTLFMGRDAFGILDIDGEGQEMIIKSCAEVGGPLEQFGTVGYKFCHGAKILYQERLLRVESGSSLGGEDDEN
ncbi:MAG: N4-gp56 family major capsid protein [Clostridia bacterium]|nr:N4-gp56 family major capsid protein [Clostridia bacterium]